MKKILMIIFLIAVFLNINCVYASSTEEMIGAQEKELGVQGFIKEAQKYTSEVFEDTNINDIYKSALTGDIKLEGLMRWYIKNSRNRNC